MTGAAAAPAGRPPAVKTYLDQYYNIDLLGGLNIARTARAGREAETARIGEGRIAVTDILRRAV